VKRCYLALVLVTEVEFALLQAMKEQKKIRGVYILFL